MSSQRLLLMVLSLVAMSALVSVWQFMSTPPPATPGDSQAALAAAPPAPETEVRQPSHGAVDDWPLFRGNLLQTGVAPGSLPEKLDILWTVKLKEAIESTAAIVGDTVYIGGFDDYLRALSLMDGSEKWAYKAGPIKAAVAVRNGVIYVGNQDGLFHAVDAATGKKRWTYETDGEIDSGATFAGEHILFGSNDGHLYCLTIEGKLVWKFKTQDRVNGSPAVIDGRTFVAGCDGSVHVVDLAKGEEVVAIDLGGPAGASAALDGNLLFVGTMNNQFLALDWKKAAVTWQFEAARRQQPFYSSAALSNTLVVVGSQDKRVYALNRATGKEVWSFLTEKKIDASPVIAGSRVYIPSQDGNLYVLTLDQGKEVQRVHLGGAVVASPAVAHGRLVIGSSTGVLYCLGAK